MPLCHRVTERKRTVTGAEPNRAGNRSGPGGRNTRGRYRGDAVPREGANFRPFGPFCRRAYPLSAERILVLSRIVATWIRDTTRKLE